MLGLLLEGTKDDPSLHDNVEIPYNWIEHDYHVGSSHDCHSRIRSGLIGGGKDTKEGRRTVFFAAVDLMTEHRKDEPYDGATTTGALPNEVESVPECSFLDQAEKCSQ